MLGGTAEETADLCQQCHILNKDLGRSFERVTGRYKQNKAGGGNRWVDCDPGVVKLKVLSTVRIRQLQHALQALCSVAPAWGLRARRPQAAGHPANSLQPGQLRPASGKPSGPCNPAASNCIV